MTDILLINSICYIELDNQPQNFLTKPEFTDPVVLSDIVNNEACKAIILKGAGRHFSAGADISSIRKMAEDNSLYTELEAGKKLLELLKSFNLPIVAAIEGVCFGGGLEIALTADIRIASEKSLFAFPEVNSDLSPGLGGTLLLSRITGRAKSLEIILGGDTIDAETAVELGIIDRLCPSKTALTIAESVINKMTNNRPRQVIQAIIKSIRNSDNLSYAEALKEETRLFCELARKVSNK